MWFDWKKYQNPKLFFLWIIQALIIIGAVSIFFVSFDVTWPEAVIAGFLVWALLWVLFQLLVLPFFIFPQIKGAVYVPSADDRIAAMLKLAKVKKKEKMIDLGAGDGRVVAAFAKVGAVAMGVELNPVLVNRAEKNLRDQGFKESEASVKWQSLWDTDLHQYDIITVYGIPYIMKKLAAKLEKEVKPGTRIVSNAFIFPDWPIVKSENEVHLYILKKRV